jgi:hypothetical protein
MSEFNTKFKQKLFSDFKAKDLTDSSINLYLRNLEKLNGTQPLKNLKFLDNIEEINKKLEPYKQNTIRNYLISCVSVLGLDKSTKKKEKLYNDYFKLMMDKNASLKELAKNQTKSETQTKNWIEWSEVLKTYENLKTVVDTFKSKANINDKQYKYLLEFMVLSCFVDIPPKRNEWRNVFIVNKDTGNLSTACNYIILSTKQFVFNQFKTSRTEGSKIENIPDNFMNTLSTYMKFHPLLKGKKLKAMQQIPFLVYDDGKPLDKINSITRVLNGIFHKRIGASMLRHIYLSSKYGNQLQEMKNDANVMGHSVDTAINSYIKV